MTAVVPPVVLDVRATQSAGHGSRGIARYAVEHADALLRLAPERVESVVLTRTATVPESAERFIGRGLGWIEDVGPAGRGGRIVHIMSPFESWLDLDALWPASLRGPGTRLAVTLYDLIPLIYADRYLADPRTRAWYKRRLQIVTAADMVFAISQSTADDANRLLGIDRGRIRVIGGGVADDFRPPSGDRDSVVADLCARIAGLRPGYFFYAGGVDFRKNMEGLVRAHAALPPILRRVHQLVITCAMSAPDRRALMELARSVGSEDDLILTGYVPDATLRALYRGAHVAVFPSLYEGFGLPIAEAARCGAPVIASDTSSMPEVIPSAEGLFNPHDEAEMTAMLRRTIEDAPFLGRLRRASARSAAARVHTWENTALATLAGYRHLARRPVPPPARRRPRMALVSPYPPDLSGIARYTESLAGALAAHTEVEVYVGGAPAEYVAPPAGVSLHSVAALRGRAALRPFDGVIHCMGNNPMHEFVLEAMAHVPGIALCHDARMSSLYAYGRRAAEFPGRVEAMYGERLGGVPVTSPADGVARGVWMAVEVLERSRAVAVHSRFAAEILRLEAEGAGLERRIDVVPFAFPPVVPRAPRRDAGADPLIASFGVLAPVKRSVDLIRAIAVVREAIPGARLALVGPVDDRYRAELERAIAELALEDAVVVTGTVGDDEYFDWMSRADIAVQLRSHTQGESSLATAETMAHGLPTVVTDLGWMSQLPADAVHRLPASAAVTDIAAALTALATDAAARDRMGRAAQRHAAANSVSAAAASLCALCGITLGDAARAAGAVA